MRPPYITPESKRRKFLEEAFFKGCVIKMVDAFFLEVRREQPIQCFSHKVRQGKTGEKGCIFTVLWG